MKTYLVTGSSGFIGFHLCKSLLASGNKVVGLDSFNNYYDINLKKSREKILKEFSSYFSFKIDIKNFKSLDKIIKNFNPDIVCHLAAQAGVRYSKKNPVSYLNSNIIGTFNLLEALKDKKIKHLIIASTSSVYSSENTVPYSELQKNDRQVSLYASTKKTCETLSHSYSHLYNIPTTCLRFFTVYGPWGRPDMAYFKFSEAISKGLEINIHNNGNMARDFTFVSDVITSIEKLVTVIPVKTKLLKVDSLSSIAPWRVVNIGNENSVNLMEFIELLENLLGKKAKKRFVEMESGELEKTFADCELLYNLIGFKPSISINEGLPKFVNWYKLFKDKKC